MILKFKMILKLIIYEFKDLQDSRNIDYYIP